MKKCPFCAEEILDEAIKCRYCHSFLSAAPPASATPPAGDSSEVSPPRVVAKSAAPVVAKPVVAKPAEEAPVERPPFAREVESDVGGTLGSRRVLHTGSPSWRAYFREFFFLFAGALIVPFVFNWLARVFGAGTSTRILAVLIPLGIGGLIFLGLHLYRKSQIFRISTTNIEFEYGILNKKIDVIELWRCRDIRYKQDIFERILQVANIEIFTADVTTPELEIVGLPASRQLFEKLRDAIEIQRQSKNVYGVIQ